MEDGAAFLTAPLVQLSQKCLAQWESTAAAIMCQSVRLSAMALHHAALIVLQLNPACEAKLYELHKQSYCNGMSSPRCLNSCKATHRTVHEMS